MAPVLMTSNDLDSLSPVAGLFKCNLSNIVQHFYQISIDSMLARSLSESWASCLGSKSAASLRSIYCLRCCC